MLTDWYYITIQALLNLWQGIADFVPKLIGALIIFFIGWLIAIGVQKLIIEVLKAIRFNQLFEKGSMKGALEKADIRVNASAFIGAIAKWIVVLVFLLAAVEVMGFVQFAEYLRDVLAYLPNVVVAVLMLAAAVIIADISEKIVRVAVEGTKVGYGNLAGAIVRWSIWVFAALAILYQLRIVPELIQTLLTGVVALIVIAGGLAFGLGGKDMAAEILNNVKKKIMD
jgi:hypothetical protein